MPTWRRDRRTEDQGCRRFKLRSGPPEPHRHHDRRLHDVDFREVGDSQYLIRRTRDVQPFASSDKDSGKVWWSSGGVHQNFTFPVQPDPVSGMHCWHQKVTVTKAEPGDRYGDVFVDTSKSMQVFEEWLAKARPADAHGPGRLRRPMHFKRVCRPTDGAFELS